MTGNNKVWRASLAGLASVAMLATMGVSALTANAAGYRITWHAADGSTTTSENTVVSLNALTRTDAKVENGKVFTGWYFDSAELGQGEKVEPGAELSSDVDIYAHWTSEDDTFKVTFADKDGVISAPADPNYDGDNNALTTVNAKADGLAAWEIPADNGVANHFLLDGWTANGKDYTTDDLLNASTVNTDADVTFTAKTADAYTVWFRSEDFSGKNWTINGTAANYGVDVKLGEALGPDNFPSATLDGRKATEWSLLKYGKKDAVYTGSEVETVKGTDVWVAPSSADYAYTVTFNYNDGRKDVTKNVTVDYGQAVAEPEAPTYTYRAGSSAEYVGVKYAFDGWYNGDKKFDFNTKFNKTIGDVTLTAKWVVSEVAVKYDPNYGQKKAVQVWYAEGDTFSFPTDGDFSRTGYKINGWTNDLAGSDSYQDKALTIVNGKLRATKDGKPVANARVIAPNTTFKAEWKVNGDAAQALKDVEARVPEQYLHADYNIDNRYIAGDEAQQKYFTAESFDTYVAGWKEYVQYRAKFVKDGDYSKLTNEQAEDLLNRVNDLQSKLVEVADTQVYRLYNRKGNGEHVYTTNKKEADTLQYRFGYENETKDSFKAVSHKPRTFKDSEATSLTVAHLGQPVYRLYNKVSGEHLLTTNTSEIADLLKGDWVADTVDNSPWNETLDPTDPAYASKFVFFYTAQNGNAPVYRLYNPGLPQAAQHHYTADKSEADGLVANHGWVYDFDGAAAFTEGR